MRKQIIYKYLIPLVLAISLVIVLLPGCDGNSTPIDPGPGEQIIRFNGVLLKDLGLNASSILANINRNDTNVINGHVVVGEDTITHNGTLYYFSVGPSGDLPGGDTEFDIFDGVSYTDILPATVPGDLSITSVLPQVKDPSDQVTVDWTPAGDASGYVIAAVKRDSAYLGIGYSQYVTSLSTSVSINDSAFTIPNIQGGVTNPGIYYIYVYAYWGILDSVLTSSVLPVPIPGQLDDNIDEKKLSGTVGAVVVSRFGSVEVIAE